MTRICLIAAVIALFIGGCKKEGETPAVPKIKTAIVPDFFNMVTDTMHYTYNDDGTVSEIKYNSGLSRRVYLYNTGTITEIFYNMQGSPSTTSTYFWKGSGLVDSFYYAAADYRYSYKYDSKGFKTEETFRGPTNNISSIYTFVNNGTNITQQYFADGSGNINASYENIYDTGKQNTIGNANTGMAFLGKDAANPVVTVNTSNSGGNATQQISYTYDSQGRITAKYFYTNAGAVIGNNTYIYY